MTLALWLAATVPVIIYYFTVLHPMQGWCQGMPATWMENPSLYCYPGSPYVQPMRAIPTLLQSSPFGFDAFFAYLTLGWLWLLPFLVLYLVLPFVWGRRAQHWWVPGLAYGLGTWLSAPWFIFELIS